MLAGPYSQVNFQWEQLCHKGSYSEMQEDIKYYLLTFTYTLPRREYLKTCAHRDTLLCVSKVSFRWKLLIQLSVLLLIYTTSGEIASYNFGPDSISLSK